MVKRLQHLAPFVSRICPFISPTNRGVRIMLPYFSFSQKQNDYIFVVDSYDQVRTESITFTFTFTGHGEKRTHVAFVHELQIVTCNNR